MKIVTLDAGTLNFEDTQWAPLDALGEHIRHEHTPHEPATIIERCAGAEVVLTNKVPLGEDVLAELPQLQLISVLATGFNIVDTGAARARGIDVCNVPAYSTEAVAQHTLALILELCHRAGLHTESVHGGDWLRSTHFAYWKRPLVELRGRTVGIIGFGTIGRRVGALVNAFGAKVMASARTPRDTPDWPDFTWASPEDILRKTDIVTLHCPQTPETTGMINSASLATMKPSAFLVNTARGGLVVEADLVAALRKNRIAGAALDVIAVEPMQPDSPLPGTPNLIITPHMAWSSEEARLLLLERTVANIKAWCTGQPQNVVNT